MFKKLTTFAAAALLAFSAHAAQFKAGEDYKILDTPKTEKPTVDEFFSFYCPHCFNSQALMDKLEKNLPEGVPFNKNHVSFMGGPMGKAFSKAYATSLMLNVDKQMKPVLFNRVHTMRKPPVDEKELRQIFIDEGVDAAKYDGTYNSFAVSSMANRFDKAFQDSGLTGVPAVIVNGRYWVTPKTIKSEEDYFALINFLLTQ